MLFSEDPAQYPVHPVPPICWDSGTRLVVVSAATGAVPIDEPLLVKLTVPVGGLPPVSISAVNVSLPPTVIGLLLAYTSVTFALVTASVIGGELEVPSLESPLYVDRTESLPSVSTLVASVATPPLPLAETVIVATYGPAEDAFSVCAPQA